jgi:hypothetical protein
LHERSRLPARAPLGKRLSALARASGGDDVTGRVIGNW